MDYKVENIIIEKKLVSKIFRFTKKKFSGVKFFTENKLDMQVGFMSHNTDHIITPHLHINRKKIIKNMSEFLIIFKGRLKVYFYNKKNKLSKTKILNQKDMILLMSGAHGFKVLRKIQMLEIKQGPFNGDKDKKRLN